MLSLSFSISCTKKLMKFPTIYVALLDRILHNVNNIHHNKNVKNVSEFLISILYLNLSNVLLLLFVTFRSVGSVLYSSYFQLVT